MTVDRRDRNLQARRLRGIAIRYDPLQQVIGTARHVGHAGSHETAGAGFGDRHRRARFPEQASHHLFQRIVVHAVNVFAGPGDHPGFDGLDAPPGFLPGPALGGETEVDAGFLGQGGDFDLSRFLDDVADDLGKARFADPRRADPPVQDDPARAARLKPGQDLFVQHLLHLAGHPGHDENGRAVVAHQEAGRRADGIVEDLGVPGHIGLDAVRLRHVHAPLGEHGFHRVQDIGMKDQVLPDRLGDDGLGHVVVGRPQPARDEHHVRLSAHDVEGLADTGTLVAHRHGTDRFDAGLRHALADVGGVGIDHGTVEQFVADRDDRGGSHDRSHPVSNSRTWV